MLWKAKVYNWLNIALSWVYSRHCFLCGLPTGADHALCSGCLAELPRNLQGCRLCAIPLTTDAVVCGPCSKKPPPVHRIDVPLRYGPPVDYLLQQLKFHRRLQLIPLMADLIVPAVTRRDDELPQLLLPVPMHRRRLRQRGYNQALELARELSRRLAIPLDWRSCRRQRYTVAQTALEGRERRTNLRGAFEVRGDLPEHVAIIDDVVTTGATVQEFAKTLHRAGVKRVEVWACARAGSDSRMK